MTAGDSGGGGLAIIGDKTAALSASRIISISGVTLMEPRRLWLPPIVVATLSAMFWYVERSFAARRSQTIKRSA